MRKILVVVGDSFSVVRCYDSGEVFTDPELNSAGRTLFEILRAHVDDCVVVQDCLFGGTSKYWWPSFRLAEDGAPTSYRLYPCASNSLESAFKQSALGQGAWRRGETGEWA
jgi:hypothetical protein